MNDSQKERLKWLAIGAGAGMLIGLLAGGRYDIKPDQEFMVWRVDRWTGKTELLGPTGQPITQQSQP